MRTKSSFHVEESRTSQPPSPEAAADRYAIVRAERSDARGLVRLLKRYVTPHNAARRHAWLYQRNPQGPAATWLACERATGEVVGFTSIFARDFYQYGRKIPAGVGLDAFVRPDHRRRGLAAALHRASLASMESGEVAFRFMCGPPVRANLDALLKAGSHIGGRVRYMTLPLTSTALANLILRRGVSGRVADLTRRLDRLARFVQRPLFFNDLGAAVQVVRGQVPADFEALWEDAVSGLPLIGRRDRDFVRWRYLEVPTGARLELVAVRFWGKLIGWGVFEFSARGALLVDHLFPHDRELAAPALRALVRHAASRGASQVALLVAGSDPDLWLLARHGFLPGLSAFPFQVLSTPDLLPALLESPSWILRSGDLDPEASRWAVAHEARPAWTDPNAKSV